MKLKRMIAVVIIATITVTLYMKLSNNKPVIEDKRKINKKIIDADNEEETQTELKKSQTMFEKYEHRFINKKPEGFSDSKWIKVKFSIMNMWKDNEEIDYYCVVLNELQQPIEGAEVTFEISRVTEDVSKIVDSLFMNIKEKETVKIISNKKGMVNLTGMRGRSFSIKKISKPDFFYAPCGKRYTFQVGLNSRPQSSRIEPVKVYLINHGTSEPLYKRGDYKDIKYNEVWDADILRRNKKGPTPEQVNLKISCKQLKEHYDTGDWEITIDPPEGIELALASKHDYVAKGLASNKIIIKNEDIGYKGEFFISFHNKIKDFYSKIKVEVSGSRKGARVRFYSYSNPIKGSKNLSYIKEKRLRDWPGVISPQK